MRPYLPAVCVIALSAVACGGKPATPPAPTAVIAAPAGSAVKDGTSAQRHYSVEVLSRYSNALAFRVGGKLMERKVRLGDHVRRGEIVARLDPVDAQKQSASAEAALTAAEHRLAFARQQLDRDEAQAKRDLIAANQLEQSQDNYAAALAAREQAAAQQSLAHNTLAYNTLTADHDGSIVSENADTGQVVTAGQSIYGLAWSGDTDVVMDVSASDIGLVRLGQAATVTFPAIPAHDFKAKVREMSPSADPQSRTYRVKLTLDAPGEQVRFGMTGDAALAAAAPSEGDGHGAANFASAIVLPATALFHQGAGAAVWVIKPADSTLELRPVTVGRYGSRTVSLTDGVRADESVVLAGVHTVFAGQHVTPVAPLFTREEAVAELAR